jgi:hypothetical protein
MILRTFTLSLLLLGAGLAQAAPSVQAVAIQGTLQVGEFLGTPGYGANPASDRGEPVYYLQLPAPLAMQLHPASALAEFSAAAQAAYFVQLTVFDEEQSVARTLVGRKVRVAGSLIESDAGHRKTPALLQVKSLAPIRDWQW